MLAMETQRNLKFNSEATFLVVENAQTVGQLPKNLAARLIDHVTDPHGYAQQRKETNKQKKQQYCNTSLHKHTPCTRVRVPISRVCPLGVLHHEGETQSDINSRPL